MKKKTAIKKVSDKKRTQLKEESKLTAQLMIRCKGLCERCGQAPDWRGLHKHEKVFRSKGGSPTDPDNCVMLCGRCHSAEHGIIEIRSTVRPYSKEMSLHKKSKA